MSRKRKEYNYEPISVWQNLTFILPMCVLLYMLYIIVDKLFLNPNKENVGSCYDILCIILFIYFMYVLLRGILTKNKNIAYCCFALVFILVICFFILCTTYPTLKVIYDYNCYPIYPFGSTYINTNLDVYCGKYVRGSSVIQLKREIEVFTTQNSLPKPISLIGADNIISNKRYDVFSHKMNAIKFINQE